MICWGVIYPGSVFTFDPVKLPVQNRGPHPEGSRRACDHREPLVANIWHDAVVSVDNVYLNHREMKPITLKAYSVGLSYTKFVLESTVLFFHSIRGFRFHMS